jgi:hypothetical protein
VLGKAKYDAGWPLFSTAEGNPFQREMLESWDDDDSDSNDDDDDY